MSDRSGGQTVMRLEGLSTYLSTRMGVVKALDGVDLEVRRGEILGIVGESGSGKTMAALSIMGLLPEPAGKIVAGHIWFEGKDLVQKSQSEMAKIRGRKIAMIPQDPMTSLNPVYTVGNQLLESIRMMERDSTVTARTHAESLFKAMNIADPARQLKNYPYQMSGGMRQRVVGAIAIAGTPSVLIADEPTTSLDATVQLQYLELLQRVQRQTGVAIILITHDFGVVAKMCHRAAVMYAGKIVESADVRDLFDHPAHPYTKALIESVPSVDRDVDFLPAIPGQPPDPVALPVGCTFAPRCPYAFGRCHKEFPPEFLVAGEHVARCWLLDH